MINFDLKKLTKYIFPILLIPFLIFCGNKNPDDSNSGNNNSGNKPETNVNSDNGSNAATSKKNQDKKIKIQEFSDSVQQKTKDNKVLTTEQNTALKKFEEDFKEDLKSFNEKQKSLSQKYEAFYKSEKGQNEYNQIAKRKFDLDIKKLNSKEGVTEKQRKAISSEFRKNFYKEMLKQDINLLWIYKPFFKVLQDRNQLGFKGPIIDKILKANSPEEILDTVK